MIAALQSIDTTLLVYGIPVSLLVAFYGIRHFRREHAVVQVKQDHWAAGLTEPPSLHPSIDPLLCIGCGSCVSACPEHSVLGLIGGKAELVAPTSCIGHGACRAACPEGAIELVFGTERRGVDIPNVSDCYETNVPGLYIAGELGGMGLIRNAVRQGAEAIKAIAETLSPEQRMDDWHDVIIVGAGPAGLSAGLAALEAGLRFRILEQESLGGTTSHYPRGKIVMTAPMDLPIIGAVKLTETTKEALLDLWNDVLMRTGLEVQSGVEVERVLHQGNHFEVQTRDAVYKSARVLLAIGRRGTPRKLGVPGEDLNKVVYRLIDAEQYHGQSVLVVGGGDSALEAALSLSDQPGTRVTLSYRSDQFQRARPKNRTLLEEATKAGRLEVCLSSNVQSITENAVVLETQDGAMTLENDYVIVCAGGILPTAFLKEAGVAVETKYGTA